jgi:hypothetical protein
VFPTWAGGGRVSGKATCLALWEALGLKKKVLLTLASYTTL